MPATQLLVTLSPYNTGWTPVMVAAVNAFPQKLQILLEAGGGADPNQEDLYHVKRSSGIAVFERQHRRQREFCNYLHPAGIM